MFSRYTNGANMKYKIKVRKVNREDQIAECFNNDIEQDEYNIHLNLLIEDISNKRIIDKVSLDDNIISIETPLKENELLEELKKLFGRELCYINYIDINQIA